MVSQTNSKMRGMTMVELAIAMVGCTQMVIAGETGVLQGTYPNFALNVNAIVSPSTICDVTNIKWGAIGDGKTDDTKSIQDAINSCGASTGVLLPHGKRFLSGALNLTSNLMFIVDGVLLGSTDPAKYPIIPALPGYGRCRDGGYPPRNGYARHQALISGWNMTSVVVKGRGTIDGQGLVINPVLNSSWASRMRAKKLDFGRPRLFEPMFSQDIGFINVSVMNQAFWALHPYACDRVVFSNVNVTAPRDEGIPNDDGIDPDSTSNVLVENCFVSVGDNSVAIKSGLDFAGREFNKPSFNQVYRDSVFTSETFAIGSEMSGGVFNITVDRCTFGGDGSDYAGVHLKTMRGRGAAIHGIRLTNLIFHMETSTKQVHPFSASLFYSGNPPPTNATATPHIYDVLLENATIYLKQGSRSQLRQQEKDPDVMFQFIGLPESIMTDFRFHNVTLMSGESHSWECQHTNDFVIGVDVHPQPGANSGCL